MTKKLNFFIYLVLGLSVILFVASILFTIRYEKDLLNTQLNTLEISIKNEYKKRLKESVNHTIMFIDRIYANKLEEQDNSSEISNNLSKKFENELIEEIRHYLYSNIFEKTRYTWVHKITDFQSEDIYAIRLIHPNLKKTEGALLSLKTEDIKGNKPYLEELNGIKENEEVYLTYYFKLLNSDQITEKLSYTKLYKKLNWTISTGIPINTLSQIIQLEKNKLEKDYSDHIFKITSIRIAIIILFVSLLLILRTKLFKTIKENETLNKKLEKKVNTLETNFHTFFDLPINILLIGNFQGEILEINSGWTKILGYTREDILNTNFLELVHPNDIEDTISEMKSLEDGKITFYFENRYRHKNGTYRTLAWAANAIKEKELIYASAQDITELKEKSTLMYQQSKMAAIGEMTSNIAHQWRQPLSIISTSSSGILLKKMANDLDDKFLIDTMNQITQSTQYLSDTIEDFSNFYSPNKNKTEFTLEKIIEKTLNLIKKRFENDNVQIIKNVEYISIVSFENELLQVLINLLNNANDQLQSIDIDTKLILINAYKKSNKIYIEIIDNGNGIEEKIINKIFEPYFTTKDKSLGTGIGLYMSDEIVTKHLNGSLRVENHNFTYKNKDYTGAKFTIILDEKV